VFFSINNLLSTIYARLIPQESAESKIAEASSSPEPGTDLGRLSVGCSGGREKLPQEQSSKKMMARKL
jgi:hypothetical protein